jgi:hypothetical protein
LKKKLKKIRVIINHLTECLEEERVSRG